MTRPDDPRTATVHLMSALGRLAIAGLALIVVAGCASESAEPAPPSDTWAVSIPPPLVPAMDLPDNAVENAVAKLDGLAEELMRKSGIPGMAVAVVHGGKTVYAKGFGVKDVRNGEKIDPDTVFQLASLSKSLSATVVAHQVGVNAIGWDTPIVEKLPWFALSDPVVTPMVTVGDMFSHRSGLPDHAGDMLEDLGHDRRYVLERLRQLPLDPFRISYAYTNFGLTAGAEAVAVSAGKSWEDLSDEVLLKPLGMASTSYRFADYEARPNRAVGHIHVDGRYEPLYIRDAQPQAPAGGVSSSVNDMTRWLAMMLGDGRYQDTQIVDCEGTVACRHPAESCPAGHRTRDAVGFLRLRLQRRLDIGGPHGAQSFRCLRTRFWDKLRHPAVRECGDRRAHQCDTCGGGRSAERSVRRPRPVRRDP